ncbi:MAG: DUF4198 domain-containing protein, partial [Synergistaceae bacterium]|nr:DUF4198 domain-containing protein [Synergistaceae bacterium]
MKKGIVKRFNFLLSRFLICAAFLTVLSNAASAHLPVAEPDKFTVSPGGSINISAGLAEPLIEFAYSPEMLLELGYAGNFAELTGEVRYSDDSRTAISFSTANPSNPIESKYSKAVVPIGKPGTAVIATRFDFNSGTRPTVAYGKTLVNWAADSSATGRHGGDEVLEIVQVGDSGPLSVGEEVKAQVFLRGRPLAGVSVSATYGGAPLPNKPANEDEANNNEYIHKTTDASGQASFRLNRAGTWIMAIEHVDDTAPKNKSEYDDYDE